MQMKFSKWIVGILAAVSLVSVASAHPGHAPTDLAAEVSQPFAGPDHFVAFVALTSVLLAAFGLVLKSVNAKRQNARK
jgi:hydrogenase/urease accessory protein HupE